MKKTDKGLPYLYIHSICTRYRKKIKKVRQGEDLLKQMRSLKLITPGSSKNPSPVKNEVMTHVEVRVQDN